MTAGWARKPFEDCISKVRATPKIQRKDFLSEGIIPIVSQEDGLINGYWNRTDDAFRVTKPVTVFGDHTRSLKYVEFDFVVGADGVKIFEPLPCFDAKFFYYQLKSLDIPSLGYSRHYRLLRQFTLSIPPLEEQRRIVAVLDEAFAAIAQATANAEKNIANARELAAVSPASQTKDALRLSIGELLERGWLIGHMDGNHGGDYPRKEEFVSAGVTYLSANCIRDGLIDFTRAKFLSEERARKLRKGFAKNRDVLFAHNATVGPVALLETSSDFVILGTSLTYYRCNEDHIVPEYLASYLRSSAFVSQYESIMRQSTRNQVPVTKQREFSVDLPTVAEQRILVKSLKKFEDEGRNLARTYQEKLQALTELKQSLLHRAFTGELTAKPELALA